MEFVVFEKLSSVINQIKNLFFLTQTSSHFSFHWSVFSNTLSDNLCSLYCLFRYFNFINFLFLNPRLYNFFFYFYFWFHFLDFNLRLYDFHNVFKIMLGMFVTMIFMTGTNTLTDTIFVKSFFYYVFFYLNDLSFLDNSFNIFRIFDQYNFFL